MEYKIGFRNNIQQTLWHAELLGQISDGQWENSNPIGHYNLPYLSQSFVTENELEIGPNYRPLRTYNFANPSMLNTIGERMLFFSKFAIATMLLPFQEDIANHLHYFTVYQEHWNRDRYETTPISKEEFLQKVNKIDANILLEMKAYLNVNSNEELTQAIWDINNIPFTMTQMKNELQDMSKAFNAKRTLK